MQQRSDARHLFADDAESALLATILQRPGLADRVRHLPPEHFASPHRQYVFRAILEATAEPLGDVVALEAAAEVLRRDGHLSAIGGARGLAELASEAITSQPEQMAAEITRAHAAREIATGLESLQRELSPGNLADVQDRLRELSRMAETAGQDSALGVLTMDTVEAEDLRWLWPGWLCSGKFHLIAGQPGQGKSFALMDLAARLSTGKVWPDGESVGPPGDTLLMAAEDDPADSIRPRLDAANADPSRVHLLQSVSRRDDQGRFRPQPVDIQRDFTSIGRHLKQNSDIRLVIVDPMAEFMGTADSNSTEQVRSALAGLLAAAAEAGAAVIGVNHFRKATGTSAIDKSGGSGAFMARARVGMVLVADQEDASRKLLLQVKNNLAPQPEGLAFEIVDGRVHWSADRVTISADEAIQPRKGPAPTARHDAEDWLRDRLRDGWVESRTIDTEGQQMGFSIGTLKRARQSIGAKSEQRRNGGKSAWWVGLPVDNHQSDF